MQPVQLRHTFADRGYVYTGDVHNIKVVGNVVFFSFVGKRFHMHLDPELKINSSEGLVDYYTNLAPCACTKVTQT